MNSAVNEHQDKAESYLYYPIINITFHIRYTVKSTNFNQKHWNSKTWTLYLSVHIQSWQVSWWKIDCWNPTQIVKTEKKQKQTTSFVPSFSYSKCREKFARNILYSQACFLSKDGPTFHSSYFFIMDLYSMEEFKAMAKKIQRESRYKELYRCLVICLCKVISIWLQLLISKEISSHYCMLQF